MINIEQNQRIAENPTLVVASPSGSYQDTDLVEFYDESNPGVIIGAFAAQYIKYGSIVYKFNEAEDLGKEILKADPESTHSAASFVRMRDELKKQMDGGNLEPESLNKVLETEQEKMEGEINNNSLNTEKEEETIDTTSGDSSGDILGDTTENNTSTTTSPIIPDISNTNTEEATSTLENLLPENNNSTSTGEVLDEATSTASEIISYAKKQIKKKIASRVKKKLG